MLLLVMLFYQAFFINYGLLLFNSCSYNPTAKLAIPIEKANKEEKAETERHSVIEKAKIDKFSI